MKKSRTRGIFYLFFIAILAIFIWQINNQVLGNLEENPAVPIAILAGPKDRVEVIAISDGDTYGALIATSGVAYATSTAIYEAAQPLYDLVKIRAGRVLELVYDKDTDELKELRYKIDTEDELFVSYLATTTEATSTSPQMAWQAKIIPIPYVVKTRVAEGTVESSMYQAAVDNEIDIRAIIELANAFQWTIDFALDPRVGDTFKFIYEERFLDGEYAMPGQVLAGKYVNDGEAFFVYYFEESEENKGFFDEEANSVQKMFLKAPVAFRYISSGFTTGLRYVKAWNVATGHRAIDYAAAYGTPVRAVGNGTAIFSGWNSGGYGNYITLHHNGTYSTNYAHLSKIYVKYGQKVKQGDTIGTVGSTGFSTGPHLHYEMVKNGVKVNPLREILPPGKPIKKENQERFYNAIKEWQEMLK